MSIHLTLTGSMAGHVICGAARVVGGEYAHAVYAPLHLADYRGKVCRDCLLEYLATYDDDESKPEWSGEVLGTASDKAKLVDAAISTGIAIIEAVRVAGPLGAPAGVLYAALMQHGCTLEQFERIMSGLESAGLVVKRGHCYTLGEAAKLAPDSSKERKELERCGVVYVGDVRIGIKSDHAGEFYVERTVNGIREDVATGFATIGEAQDKAAQVAAELNGGAA